MIHPINGIPCSPEDRKLIAEWTVKALNDKKVPAVFLPFRGAATGKTAAANLIKAIIPDAIIMDGVSLTGCEGTYIIHKVLPPGRVDHYDKITIELQRRYHLTYEEYEPIRIAAITPGRMSKYLLLAAVGMCK